MTIFRVIHNKNYSTINNTICTDKRLSWKAKGIFLYAFSRPDYWQFHLSDIINQSQDKEKSVRAGLKELELCGYLLRSQERENGKFKNYIWDFYETPQTKTQEIKIILPLTQKRQAQKRQAVKDTLISTELKSTDLEKQQPHTPSPSKPVVVVFYPKTLERLKTLQLDENQLEDLSNLNDTRLNLAIDFVTDPRFEAKKGIIQTLKWHVKAKVPPVHSTSQKIENSQQIEEARKYIEFVRSLRFERQAKKSEEMLKEGYISYFSIGKWSTIKIKDTDIKELKQDLARSRKELTT
jgi:hypothetical protein